MGEVHVFHRQGGVWSFGRTFRASAPDSLDYFGCSVALSADGRVLAVGAEREDSARSGDPADNTAWDSGAVYVFEALDGPSPQTP